MKIGVNEFGNSLVHYDKVVPVLN